MNKSTTDERNKHNGGYILELVGPAGSGKTSLYKELQKKEPWIVGENIPPIRSLAYSPYYLKNICSLIPVWFKLFCNGTWKISWQDVIYIALLNGWDRILKEKSVHHQLALLLDQGPIYIIAYLHMYSPINFSNTALIKWWNTVFDRWLQALDMVVYLDTRTDILTSRIQNRQEKVVHHVTGKSDEEASRFIESYRHIYELIFSRIKANNNEVLYKD
jgi:hypothetical protein